MPVPRCVMQRAMVEVVSKSSTKETKLAVKFKAEVSNLLASLATLEELSRATHKTHEH